LNIAGYLSEVPGFFLMRWLSILADIDDTAELMTRFVLSVDEKTNVIP